LYPKCLKCKHFFCPENCFTILFCMQNFYYQNFCPFNKKGWALLTERIARLFWPFKMFFKSLTLEVKNALWSLFATYFSLSPKRLATLDLEQWLQW
jgi:hypothetical protein